MTRIASRLLPQNATIDYFVGGLQLSEPWVVTPEVERISGQDMPGERRVMWGCCLMSGQSWSRTLFVYLDMFV